MLPLLGALDKVLVVLQQRTLQFRQLAPSVFGFYDASVLVQCVRVIGDAIKESLLARLKLVGEAVGVELPQQVAEQAYYQQGWEKVSPNIYYLVVDHEQAP